MKIYKILFIAIFNIFLTTKGFAQDWQWVSPGGGTQGDEATLLCHDGNGNFYVGGVYYSDPAFFENDTIHLSGRNEMYVAKYNSVGQMQWIISFGGNSTFSNEKDNLVYLIYRPQQNSLLLGGSFNGRMILGNDTLYGNGGFLAELDLNGVFSWGKTLGYSCLCVDETGNIFTQHPFPQSNYIDTLYVNSGLWFAKFDPEGNLLWAKRKANAQPNSIYGTEFAFFKMVERNGIITGYGNARADTLRIDTVTTYNYNFSQNILACFDTSITALWIKPFAGNPQIPSFDYTQDKWGNNYITSAFRDSAFFGSDTITTRYNHTSDAFICKFDSAGNFQWVGQLNGDSLCSPWNITCDNDGAVLCTGIFNGEMVLINDTLNSSGISSFYLVQYDSSGNVQYYYIDDYIGIHDCEFDSSGYLTASGTFVYTADFNGTSVLSKGMSDAFIARSSPLTAIEENARQQNNQLVIYANPNQGRCNLEIPDEFVHERSLLLQIFDNSGRMIQQTQVIMNEDKVRVNLEAEAKGIYNVILSNMKKSYQGKIVFE